MYFAVKVIRLYKPLTSKVPVVTAYRITGRSFSPSSIDRSWNFFLALSIFACSVSFCTLNSLITLVPSLYAWKASACASRTWSRCEATADSTPTARVPSSCISLNNGAIASNPPLERIASRKVMRPVLASSFIIRENSFTSRPAILAKRAGSWNILVINCEKTVAEVAASC